MKLRRAMCNYTLLPLTELAKINIKALLILDMVPAVATVIFNTIFILTLIATRLLHRPSNVLLGALSVSDLIVGFIARPLYLSFLFKMLLGNEMDLDLLHAFTVSFFLSGGLSFSFVAQVSLDRYMAVCHPFLYSRFATCRKHLIMTSVTCVAWLAFALLQINASIGNNTFYKITTILHMLIMIATTAFSYTRIHAILLKKRNAILTVGVIDGKSPTVATDRHQERAKTHVVGIIVGFFFLSYTPYVTLVAYFAARGNGCWNSDVIFIVNTWVNFLLLWNSCINTVIYFVKSGEMRRACIRMFFS